MSELAVLIKAKDLAEYIFTITDKSPKKYRMTLTLRLQNLSLDIIECLHRANRIKLLASNSANNERRDYMSKSAVDLELLCSIAEIAKKQQCIQAKHYFQICRMSAEIHRLINAWAASDERRIAKNRQQTDITSNNSKASI